MKFNINYSICFFLIKNKNCKNYIPYFSKSVYKTNDKGKENNNKNHQILFILNKNCRCTLSSDVQHMYTFSDNTMQ